MNLRSRIILAMTAIMVLSLVVIGAVTISFFKAENEKYHQERLARKEKAIKAEMAYYAREVEIQENLDVVLQGFEEEVLRLATVHGMDITVYNTRGDLLVSAEPDSGSNHPLHQRVPPAAMEQLSMTDRVVLPDLRNNTEILSDYTVLRNSKSERIAILHLPYKPENSLSDDELQSFLQSIGLTYVFLFLAALALTILLSNSLTRNLRFISTSMEQVDFDKHNEPLHWRGNDEVGKLISAYNHMLVKLEESRALLSQKEREEAWREMAKQVAHEIKNPLTPIKLSVQHLMATADFQDKVWQEKFQNTMRTIIQQADSLTRIASEFSDFAKMPAPAKERLDARKAIEDVRLLFAESAPFLEVSMPETAVMVNIDKDAFGRVLSNLVKNAKQATQQQVNRMLHIRLTETSDTLRIQVEDNGGGIDPALREKIFQPNFTTKSSGSGLGLAICKQVVEQAGGRIWLELEQPGKTIFIVELPKE